MIFKNVKGLTLPNGKIKKLSCDSTTLWKSVYKNWVSFSINADGTIYNGGLGYKDGYRVRSGGVETTYASASCSGYIKVYPGDEVRVSGIPFTMSDVANAINVYDINFENLGQLTPSYSTGGYGIMATIWLEYSWKSIIEESPGIWKWVVPPAESKIAHIRLTGRAEGDGSKMIVTINEKIE